MPDMGGLRRGLTERAKQATQQVSQAGLQHYGNLSSSSAGRPAAGGPPQNTQGDEAASSADVAQEVSRLSALLARRRPPSGPVRGRWSIGIGDLLAEHPRMPNALRGLARNLDRYGGLAITERTVEFDHDAIEWASVTEVRTRNLVEYLLSDALDQQLDTMPLPWFPGRRKVLDALSKAMLTLLVAAAKQQLDQHVDIRIPAEVEYRGTIRRHRQLAPGVLAALVLADPAVNQCLQATARAHGIVVRPAGDAMMDTAGQRADVLKAKLASLEAKLDRGQAAPPAPAQPPMPASVRPPMPPPNPQQALWQNSPTDAQAAAAQRNRNYELPDQGRTLVRLAADVAGERGAAMAGAEVDRVRRPDGALVAADLRDVRKEKDGPLYILGALLGLEAITVSVWAGSGFGMLQKRSASKQVEQLCREQGVAAAVDWALANGSRDRLHLSVLRDGLDDMLHGTTLNEAGMRDGLRRCFRKWR